MDEDEAVVNRVLAGDPEAFRALVLRYQEPLFRMAGNLLSDPQGCEDVVQEVFLSAYEHLKGFDPKRSRFSTWLFTIARNRCLSELRKKKPDLPGELDPPSDTRNPLDTLSDWDMYLHLDKALASLPAEQKTVFVLREFMGLDFSEIARIENAEEGTLRSRLSRAKARLRAVLGMIAGEEV
jgi:RNA polymerase sigma-70 factor (ECF subfamily)